MDVWMDGWGWTLTLWLEGRMSDEWKGGWMIDDECEGMRYGNTLMGNK